MLNRKTIFIVDDEPTVLKAISETLKSSGYKPKSFTNALDCIESLYLEKCNVIITDVNMPGVDGIELLTQAKQIAPWVPVVVITGYGDIPMAVNAVKKGAMDFIEKPLERDTLLAIVEKAILQNPLTNPKLGNKLTKTEKIVLKLVADGNSTKKIAAMLNRATRTVEDHRSNIMKKLNVDNVIDLVKRAIAMKLVNCI